MPLGKYYCDYCDKQFQDTPFHRKRHIQGLHHQKAKALWYASPPPSSSSDHNHIVSSITTTGVCNRFIRTFFHLFECFLHTSTCLRSHRGYPVDLWGRAFLGSCPYGNSCKYFHPNQNLQNRNMQGFTVTNSMETQLVNFPGSQSIERSSLPGGMVLDRTGVMVGNLPPSLRPPPEGGYPPLPFIDWG